MWYDCYCSRKGDGSIKADRGHSAMSERKMIHGMKTDFTAGETDNEIVITVETSPALMPPAWVNFLKQRLHVLHLDYEHIGAGRIVVLSTPHAAESVARLVLSAMECADHCFKASLRNMRAHGIQTPDDSPGRAMAG